MTNKQQQILDFLKDKNQRQLIITTDSSLQKYENIFYKVDFYDFDYVYCIDYIRNNIIQIDIKQNNNLACVIDKKTNKIYFDRYDLYKNFDEPTKCEEYEALKGKSEKELCEEINNRLYQEILKIAENVTENKLAPNEEDWQRKNAERMYFLNETNEIHNFLHKKYINFEDLLQYLQDKDSYINSIISGTETLGSIKQEKAYYNARQRFLKEIKANEEYKYFRLAKQIKDSIPEYAKQVTLFYKKNDEVIQCKYATKELFRFPYYGEIKQDVRFCEYGLSSKDIAKINEDIYIKNILKITYNGKTLYEQN